jgi:MerR family mercuric resistance operon transcriptional regulator
MYGLAHVMRLSFVRRARELGFTLDEVRALLLLADQEDHACADARELAARHLNAVRMRVADLHRMEVVLAGIIECCGDGATPECPLLETLFDDSVGPTIGPGSGY